MGSFSSSIFSVMLSWLRGIVSYLWQAASSPRGSSLLQWLAENWLTLALILCAAGMLIDAVVYILRWQPYKVWASFFRRITGHGQAGEAEQEQRPARRTVHRRWVYADGTARTEAVEQEDLPEAEDRDPWQDVTPLLPDRSLDEDYRRQYARPESQATVQAPAAEQYQPSVEPVPEPEAEPSAQPGPVGRRGRRAHNVNARSAFQQLFASHDEDELDLRYRPAQLAVDKEQAYSKPYYPPQWRPPAEVGPVSKDE